jgi:hypothetical protein
MAEYMSELTKKTLQQFGWQLGEPVPENMGELLAGIHERTPASKVPGLYVDASAMSEKDVELIKQKLAAAKVRAIADQERAEKEKKTAGMSQNMRELYEKVSEMEAGPAIIDDRATAPADTQEAAAEIQASATAAPVPPIVTEPPEPPVNLLAPVIEPFCPRCSWDMRQKYESNPTEVDKEIFMASILGGTRMHKNYSIMGGRYNIKFRGLLAEENRQIHHQMLLDQKRDGFGSDTEWFLRFFEYRLACSIEAVVVDDKVIALVPELENVAGVELPNKTDNKELDPLTRLRNYVVLDVLKIEVTRRLVCNQFRQFQRLYEAMEAMALEPNFW